LGAAFFTKKAAFRSFLKKAAPKTSVILRRVFETVSKKTVLKVVPVSRIGVISEHWSGAYIST
jgi:hypothetical protein